MSPRTVGLFLSFIHSFHGFRARSLHEREPRQGVEKSDGEGNQPVVVEVMVSGIDDFGAESECDEGEDDGE